MKKERNRNSLSNLWQGGSIGILIEWECNLDLRIEKCIPKYSFQGLYGNNSQASVGYNFRWVK